MFIIYIDIVISNWQCFYTGLTTLYVTLAKLAFMLFNLICFATSQLTIAHIYVNLIILYVTFTLIFFAKLRQVDNILKKPSRTFIRFTQVSIFMRHHTNTLRQVMIADGLISASLTMYMVMNFPANLYLIMFFFGVHNSQEEERYLGVYLFCLMLISTQLFGYLIIHLVSAMYTRKLHNHSKILLQINARRQFNSLGSVLKLTFYIEKFHTKRQYGYTYFNLGLITMKTFIEVRLATFVFRFKLIIFFNNVVSVVLRKLHYDDLCFVSKYWKSLTTLD